MGGFVGVYCNFADERPVFPVLENSQAFIKTLEWCFYTSQRPLRAFCPRFSKSRLQKDCFSNQMNLIGRRKEIPISGFTRRAEDRWMHDVRMVSLVRAVHQRVCAARGDSRCQTTQTEAWAYGMQTTLLDFTLI